VASYQVELHPEAAVDAQGVYDQIFKDSPQSAGQFAEAFDEAVRELKETAHIWDAKLAEKKYFINRYRVTLIYRIRGDIVTIGAAAHQRRKPGYWKDRDF
jgi:plasmid stabilization system protein ParE